jgi:hypothetical protein
VSSSSGTYVIFLIRESSIFTLWLAHCTLFKREHADSVTSS